MIRSMQVRGMDICFVTTAKTDEEAKELLKLWALRSPSKEENVAKTSHEDQAAASCQVLHP